jgi:hypothetical protein
MYNQLISSTLGRLWKSVEDALANRGFESRRPDHLFVRNGRNKSVKTRSRAKVSWLIAALLFGIASFEGTSRAQEASPGVAESSPSPSPSPAEQAAPEESPAPALPPQTAPDLLPESKTVPPLPPESALPPDLIPERPKAVKTIPLPSPGSAEQLEKDRIRFRQIRTIAVRNSFAIFLAKRANQEKTEEGRREYFRAYYTSMAVHMRKLEPKLKPFIDGFEAGNLGRFSPTGLRPTIPLRDLGRFERLQAAAGASRKRLEKQPGLR